MTRCKDVAVVGGGFLGTEVSLAMANRGMKVWQVYAEAAPLSRYCIETVTPVCTSSSPPFFLQTSFWTLLVFDPS